LLVGGGGACQRVQADGARGARDVRAADVGRLDRRVPRPSRARVVVNDALIRRVLTPRGGAAGCVALVVRVVAGSLFIAFGIGKFADHMKEAIDFQSYGVPLPDVAVYV